MLITTVLLALLILIIFADYNLRILYKKVSNFPGPKTWPIIGNAHIFLGGNKKIIDSIFDLMNNFPSLLRFWIVYQPVFIVYDAEHLKVVLNSQKTMEKVSMYRFGEPWAGTGLITAPLSKWRKHRKIIAPTFHQSILDTFIPVFDQQSKILVGQLSSKVGGGEFEIYHYISLCTLDMVCETTMGVSMKAQTDPNCLYASYADEMFKFIYQRALNILIHPDFIFNITKSGRLQKKYLKYLHNFTSEVIQKKKSSVEKLKNCNIKIDSTTSTQGKKIVRKAFLDLLVELSHDEEKLTDKELLDEVNTMLIAGNETTASVNAFVLLMLAIHPDVQEKVYKEISQVYAQKSSTDECLTNEDLNKFEYLERVIKETMRIFTAVPILGREVTDDLEIDGKVVPKGSIVILGYLKTHRDEKYWPDPLKFDPDRFLPEEVAKRHPYSYLPFAGGPRSCVGKVYGMMSIKILLSNVLMAYKIKKDNSMRVKDIKLKISGVLRTVDPIKIKIEKRALFQAESIK